MTDTYVNEHGDFSIECLWGRDELPTAVLRITSPGQMAYDWCKVYILCVLLERILWAHAVSIYMGVNVFNGHYDR